MMTYQTGIGDEGVQSPSPLHRGGPAVRRSLSDRLNAREYIEAARVPSTLEPQHFGLWSIGRCDLEGAIREAAALGMKPSAWHIGRRLHVGFPTMTILRRYTEATMMTGGEVVMEDSTRELRRHLPIWMAARGRVLVTGLGLGCVVRGLLANPRVDHVDVIEIDADILRVVGQEFAGNSRVSLIHGDALKVEPFGRWDFAWHDLWMEGDGLQLLHAKLFARFHLHVGKQGAWAFPRSHARLYRRFFGPLLGAPK